MDWLYEARLDTQTKRMTLFRQAAIRQGSGEDWVNAEVSVTTAKPRQNAGTPPVKSVFLRLQDYAPSSSELQEIVVTGSRRGGGRRNASAEDDVEGTPLITTEEFATEFVQDFRVPSRVSINADRQTRVYPVSEETFDTDLRRARRDGRGSDGATRSGVPLRAGNTDRSGPLAALSRRRLRGRGESALLLPGSDVRVPFGVDERIRIVVRDEKPSPGAAVCSAGRC